MEQKKRGRPIRTPGEKLEATVLLNMTQKQKNEIKALCKNLNISFSRFMRDAADIYLKLIIDQLTQKK
jgi:methionyl-tRNA synthetase